jgi:hypothetical protein
MMHLVRAEDKDRRFLTYPKTSLHSLPKLIEGWPHCEEEKVRLALAIRRAEPGDGNGGSPQRADDASPLMLATNPAARIPDPIETGVGAQVINVPVGAWRQLLMVRDAGPDTSRPDRAADVNVETSLKLQLAEFPDLDQLSPGTEKD